jgi:hypothetical protein
VQIGSILRALELRPVEPLVQGGVREALPERLSAPVGLHDGVDLLHGGKLICPLVAPVARTREAKRRQAVMPEGVAVALALDQEDVAGLLNLFEPPEAVEGRLRALAPSEAVVGLRILLQRQPEAHGGLGAVSPLVRDADRRRAGVSDPGEPEAF